jgi:SAM-dependent methyltransferase
LNEDTIIEKYSFLLPFVDFVWWNLNKNVQSILDVGCGLGKPISTIKRHRKFYTIGLDRFSPSIKKCKQLRRHDEYIICDVRFLPIRTKSVDTVHCLQVIEHLKKIDGLNLIQDFDRIACHQIILATPVGFLKLKHGHKENPTDLHKSGWVPCEFQNFGYKVRGIDGLKCVSGASFGGIGSKFAGNAPLTAIIRYWVYFISYLSRPIGYFFPNIAFCMLGIKNSEYFATN